MGSVNPSWVAREVLVAGGLMAIWQDGAIVGVHGGSMIEVHDGDAWW